MTMYLGLDLHGKSTFAHVQDGEGTLLYSGEIATTAEAFADLCAKLAIPAGSQAAMESGTMAGFVSGILEGLGLRPVVINAREVRQKARRVGQKSDSRDAFEICDGWRRGIFTGVVWVPTPEVCDLRRLVAARATIVGDRTMAINRTKALFRGEGIRMVVARLDSEKAWQRALAQLAEGSTLRAIAGHYHTLWKAAREGIEGITTELDKLLAEKFPRETELLCSVPGVGPIVAASFIAAIGMVSRFPDSAHVASYLGLVPSTYDSGGRERHGAITRHGNPYARAMLCEAAQHARRSTNPLTPYMKKLMTKAGYKRAVVAVAHRLARIMYQLLKTGQPFNVQKLGVDFAPYEKKVQVLYRLKKSGAGRAKANT